MSVHYISPYRCDKNIGLAINEAIKAITFNADDWVILTDHDMLWLLPDSKAQVERILAETDFDVLGCMTNRIRSKEQLVGGVFNEDDRVREHIRIAEKCREVGGNSVKTANGCVAAFMMAFRASVWAYTGGFTENAINFDRLFCDQARTGGAKIGIMQGVYVWHSYRLMSSNPKQQTSHLTI